MEPNTVSGQVSPAPRAPFVRLFKKQVGGKEFVLGKKKRLRHGAVKWAEFEGVSGRTPLYFNEYLYSEGETPWEACWMSLVDLRKTPKPYFVDPDDPYVNPWIQKLIDLGRVVKKYAATATAAETKTESVGHRPHPKLDVSGAAKAYPS